MSESPERRRRRWINLGELIALAALIVSALGVWIAWKSSNQDKPTRGRRAALSRSHSRLRGTADSDGRTLTIMPADPAHALQSLKVTIKGASPIDVGSDGTPERERRRSRRSGTARRNRRTSPTASPCGSTRATSRTAPTAAAAAAYVLRYRWEGGGLFGGRSLRLIGLAR